MRWDFNPADTNVIAHAVTFSSNVLFYTFFLVLRGTPIHLRPQRAQGSLPLDPRKLIFFYLLLLPENSENYACFILSFGSMKNEDEK